MIDEKTVEEIRAKADIVEIIGRYVQLKKRGRNFLGLCPFHQEKTPSFTVSPEKEIFHCFGCQAGGNVFTFLMELEKITFVEAVKLVGEIVGIEVKDSFNQEQVKTEKTEKDLLYKINEEANNFFKSQINQQIQEYFKKRVLSEETVKNFELGFAPDNWSGLYDHLKVRYSADKIMAAGLIIQKESGPSTSLGTSYYDRFRSRLMFPIRDIKGKIIGFSGRIVVDDPEKKQAKYVNSPETIIFNKGNQLYGLNLAKDKIKRENLAILVEGQMDVLACHTAGLINTVASLGTAFTPNQARLLARYTKNVVIAYDKDEAGLKATDRTIEVLLPLGFNIKILDIPAKDPDEMLKKAGPENLKKAVKEAVYYIEFKLTRIVKKYEITNIAERSQAAKECMTVIADIDDKVMQDQYLTYLSKLLNLEKAVLQESIKSSTIRGLIAGGVSPLGVGNSGYLSKKYTPAPISKFPKAEIALLRLMIGATELRDKVFEELAIIDFDEEWQPLLKYLKSNKETDDKLLKELKNTDEEENIRKQITGFLTSEDIFLLENYQEYVNTIKERKLIEEKNSLRKALIRAEKEGNEEEEIKIALALKNLKK